jgi:hypothetical protein
MTSVRVRRKLRQFGRFWHQKADIAQQTADTKAQKLNEDQYQFQQGLMQVSDAVARMVFHNPAMAGQSIPYKAFTAAAAAQRFDTVDMGEDGTFLKDKQTGAMYKVSAASLGLSKARITAAGMAARAGIGNWKDVHDAEGNIIGYVQPGTNQFKPVTDIDGLGAATGATGQSGESVIPVQPTAQMRNVGAQAQVAADKIPDVIKEIDQMRDSLGPVSGNWNAFMQGKIGLRDPALAGLRADLLMTSSYDIFGSCPGSCSWPIA